MKNVRINAEELLKSLVFVYDATRNGNRDASPVQILKDVRCPYYTGIQCTLLELGYLAKRGRYYKWIGPPPNQLMADRVRTRTIHRIHENEVKRAEPFTPEQIKLIMEGPAKKVATEETKKENNPAKRVDRKKPKQVGILRRFAKWLW